MVEPGFELKSGGFQSPCSYSTVLLTCDPCLSIECLLGKATLVKDGKSSFQPARLFSQEVFPCVLEVTTVLLGSVQKGAFPFSRVFSFFSFICHLVPHPGQYLPPHSDVHVLSSGISTDELICQPLETSLPHTTAVCRVGTDLILQCTFTDLNPNPIHKNQNSIPSV